MARVVDRQGNILNPGDELNPGEETPRRATPRTGNNTMASTLSGQDANRNAGGAFNGTSGFNTNNISGDQARGDQTSPETSPYEPPPATQRQPGSGYPDAKLQSWWDTWSQRHGDDPAVRDWWSRYEQSTPVAYDLRGWMPETDANWANWTTHPNWQQRDRWLQALQTGWHQGFLNNIDPYQEGLTYHQDPSGAAYDWSGADWRTGVPTGYHLDPATSADAAYKEWAAANNIVGPWTADHADFAQWRDDARFRQAWADRTAAAYTAAQQGGTKAGRGPVPSDVEDPNAPKWDPWKTDEGSIANRGNIIRFLQTHFAGRHNLEGLVAAEPYLQWLFGTGVKVNRRADGSVYDSLWVPGIGTVDVIRAQTGDTGGEEWVWFPDAEKRDGGTTARDGVISTRGGVTTDTDGSVSYPPPAYWPGTVPTTPITTYNPFTFSNDPLELYTPFQFSNTTYPTYDAATIPQYTAPDQSALTNLQQATMWDLLQNPTYSDQVLSQMKENQKDTILSLGQQLAQDVAQRAAAQGTFGGGLYGQNLRDIQLGQAGDLTKAYRELDVQAAEENRAARERAMTLSEDFQRGQLDRSILGYETGLEGLLAQARERALQVATEGDAARFAREGEQLNAQELRALYDSYLNAADWQRRGQLAQADENRFGFQSRVASEQDQIQRFLLQEQLNQAAATGGLANYLGYYDTLQGAQNLGLDRYIAANRAGLDWANLDLNRIIAQNNQSNWIKNYLQNA